ncbi:TetR/AcrR family transcriptional regulator [Lentzea flava]|uniref:Transcriptional regulator TetR family protein n=1 Tax=Lentzea flava TaxID=103732 RepID=A0ABQ2UB23_9PSEU|nr:TetR/AcrR family transcriptional regulator [Lentzea flava]MCP2196412.1 transcriptional regulator, TetR family [Lentzea flava]GGU17995.1 putative transcriptional regulator TetR family protein [Lentzea flava]
MSNRRAELLELAARMFAERGYGQTTVRDIADAAGILSGSLYHHFDSKESMVDEILRTFLDELFTRYREIVDAGLGPKQTLKALVVASFEAIDTRHAEVAIYQNESKHLMPLERFSYLDDRNVEFRKLWTVLLEDGIGAGVFRADLDVDLAYRFIRDTVWVAVRWYRPGGGLSADAVADQYLAILLDGIATGRRKNSKT